MDDQLNNWMDLWDKAQAKWAMEPQAKPRSQKSGSFFGLQNNPTPEEGAATPEEGDAWRGIYDRAAEIREEQPSVDLLFHEQAEGWRRLLTPPGKGVTFFQHPQHQTAIGMDQGKSPYEPTRVAPNFTDGKELRELSDLKVKLERLESTLLGSEIRAGKANVPATSYKSQLDRLRQQIDDLSDKLSPRVGTDVY